MLMIRHIPFDSLNLISVWPLLAMNTDRPLLTVGHTTTIECCRSASQKSLVQSILGGSQGILSSGYRCSCELIICYWSSAWCSSLLPL